MPLSTGTRFGSYEILAPLGGVRALVSGNSTTREPSPNPSGLSSPRGSVYWTIDLLRGNRDIQ